jgi:hypothetical protein
MSLLLLFQEVRVELRRAGKWCGSWDQCGWLGGEQIICQRDTAKTDPKKDYMQNKDNRWLSVKLIVKVWSIEILFLFLTLVFLERFLFYLWFRWGILHRVLLVVGWCWVLYSSGFLCVSSHYLILPSVNTQVF